MAGMRTCVTICRLTDRGTYRLIDHKNLSMWLIIYQLTKKVWLQLSFFTHSSHCFQMSWIVFRFCGPWVKFEIYHKLTNLALRNTKHNQKFPSDQRTSCPAGFCPLLAWLDKWVFGAILPQNVSYIKPFNWMLQTFAQLVYLLLQ